MNIPWVMIYTHPLFVPSLHFTLASTLCFVDSIDNLSITMAEMLEVFFLLEIITRKDSSGKGTTDTSESG